ncbi:MAG: hypothetical protein Q8P67_17970, partial [archaeon]|nr:hypothetical protein [archaeon]
MAGTDVSEEDGVSKEVPKEELSKPVQVTSERIKQTPVICSSQSGPDAVDNSNPLQMLSMMDCMKVSSGMPS